MKWIIALLMLAALVLGFAQTALAAEYLDYETAYNVAQQTDKPLVILVGAEWCQPCKQVQKEHGSVLREHGVYMHMDVDRHPDLVGKIYPRRVPIPALIVWQRVHHAWQPPKIIMGADQIGVYIREALP